MIIRKQIFVGSAVLVALISLFLTIHTVAAALPEPAVKPIVIGFLSPLKFVYGLAGARAATLAVEEINAAGGVNVAGGKYPFKIEIGDCRSTEPGTPVSESLIVAEKLILDKGVRFFVSGPTRSEASLAAMDLFSKYKTVTIQSTGTLSPEFHKRVADNYDKYKYIFRQTGEVGWMIKEFTELFAQFETNYGFKKVSVFVQDVAHARAGGDIVASILEKRGWTVVGKDRFPTGSSDFSTPLLKAKEGGAQVMMTWFDAPEVLVLVKQWFDLKIPALPIGFLSHVASFETWKETEGKCEYWINNQVNAGICYANFNPWVVKWWDGYKKRWGKEPESYGVQVPYTAVYVLKDAIERANSLDPDKVIKALEETDLKDTPQGRIRFDPKSHQIISSLDPKEGAVGSIFQWQKGKRVLVFPPKIAVGRVQLPPWMK